MQADAEHRNRWQRAQQRCAEEGLDGLLVWSRGGGSADSFADVLYLANHYSPFPLVADVPPHWSGRAHSAVLLPADGEPSLIVDHPDWRRDLVVIEDVRFTLDLPATAAELLRERGLAGGRIGLVGRNAMLARVKDALVTAAAGTELVPVDDLVERLRAVKSPYELDRLREAAAVGDRVVGAVIEAALRPGTTEAEAVAAGYALAVSEGVALYDAAVASGPNSDYYAYGRLPSWTRRELEAGDLFHMDTYGALDGYLYDFARCCVSGGSPTPDQVTVMEAVIDAVHAGVDAVAPGVPVGAIYDAVHAVLVDREMTPPDDDGAVLSALTISFPAHGHSYGMGWERPWFVPGGEEPLVEGMCIGVEGMAGRTGVGSAKFEQDVIVGSGGAELITKLETHFW